MNIAEYAIEKKVITYLMVIILLVGGYTGFRNLGKLEDPDFTIREVRVTTQYPGATPQEVEEEVSDVIERAAQQMSQVENVYSESSNSLSIVTVEFYQGIKQEEYRQIYDELRRKVNDAQTSLPPGAGPSMVNDDFGDVYGIFYAITGEGYSQRELYDHTEYLEKELLLVPGVAKIELWGAPREVVYLEISRTQLTAMDISEDYIYDLLQNQNMIVDSGTVPVGDSRMRFRSTGSLQTISDIGSIVISSSSDAQITLDDIADISHGYQDPPNFIMRYNGKDGIGLGISVMEGGNVVEIGGRIKDRLAEIERDTPIGMEVETIMMQGDSVQKAITGFVMNLVQSVVIVIGLLMIFMGLQSGVLIGGMLILIIAGTLFVMYLFNITLQRISLGALIIAMGMLVDNSIVITEGMLVRFEKGENKMKAAREVINQTIWPLFGATVVAIFAFAAVGMSPDSTGEYTKSLFYVIIISLMLSWFLAITVNPLLCVKFLNPKIKVDDAELITKDGVIMASYKKLLKGAIANKYFSCLILVLLLVLSAQGFTFIKTSFFPDSEQPQFLVDYWLPEGTDIYKTSEDMKDLEQYLMKMDNVKRVSTFVGSASTRFQLTFTPEKPNSRYGMFIVETEDSKKIPEMFPVIQDHFDNYNPDSMTQLLQFKLGPSGKGTIAVRFKGPDSEVLRDLSSQVKEIYHNAGAVAIRDDWGEKAPVIQAVVDDVQARRTGLTRPQINSALQQAFAGRTVGLYREGNKLLPVISRPPEEERSDVIQTNDIQIWSPMLNRYVPIAQIAESTGMVWEDSRIQRENRMRTIEVKCDPREGLPSVVFNMIRPEIEALPLPPGYTMEWGGEYENSQRANAGIAKTFPLAFLAMILTILILWNKVKQPIIIFLSIPLCLIGVTLGLLVTGIPLGFMAILGSLALFGMAIKNAIVMVDEIDLQIKEGKAPYQALIDASLSRVRPVMMAALSTVMGMAPLLSDVFFQSMAVAIMFGLSFAAFLTLIITPTLYAVFFKITPPDEENSGGSPDGQQAALTAES